MITGTKLIQKTESAYSYPLLLKQLLLTPIIHSPDQEIVYRDTRRFTYRDFYARTKRLASGLGAVGVKPGDVVAFMDWDSYRYLEAYFGVPGIGAVLMTVNVRLSPEQLVYTMSHAEVSCVFVHQDFIPLAEAIKDQVPMVKKWIYMLEPTKDGSKPEIKTSVPFECEYEDVLAKGDEDYEFPDFDENSQATLFYTTGTTGDPKGVFFSHRQLVLHTLGLTSASGAIKSQSSFQSDDVYMPITPMFHVHAWGMPYMATMLGVKQVYPGRYEPELLLKLLITEHVTFSHCVPTIIHMLVSSPAIKQFNLKGWKVVIGGSALPRGLAKACLELGINIYTGYGMSETCPVLTLALLKPDKLDSDLEYQLDVRTKTGLPVPLVDLKVVDPQMRALPRDGQSAGEIVVRAPWLTQGYYKAPEKGEELWHGGYLHTGDVAFIDEEGYVKITDRLKDVIKTGGEWVSSLELESLISQYDAISEVAVVGIPDEKWGERPLAMVVAKAGQEVLPEKVKEFLQQFVDDGTVSKWAIPDKIAVVAEIPKTSVGKIDKKRIRADVA